MPESARRDDLLSIDSIITAGMVYSSKDGMYVVGKAGDRENQVAAVAQIEEFLALVRIHLAKPGKFDLVHRQKNLASMAQLGFTVNSAKQVILGLNYRDYNRGPLPDHRGDGYVWEFIKNVDGVKIYIKLKIDESRGCVCLGFHESVGQCLLPYRHHPSSGGM